MATFKWFDGEVPSGIKVTQVYGIIFTEDGRMMLKVRHKPTKTEYSFAGGTPEDFDDGMLGTLTRELEEEINTTITNPVMLGYQLVDEENGKEPYAQVRMACMIDVIGEKLPDPDNGEIYDRLLTTPEKAIKLLGWGEVAELQIGRAVEVAKNVYNIVDFTDNDQYV